MKYPKITKEHLRDILENVCLDESYGDTYIDIDDNIDDLKKMGYIKETNYLDEARRKKVQAMSIELENTYDAGCQIKLLLEATSLYEKAIKQLEANNDRQ